MATMCYYPIYEIGYAADELSFINNLIILVEKYEHASSPERNLDSFNFLIIELGVWHFKET